MMSEATNNPAYLTKVEIRGLWGRYDLDWNLNSDVNVLAGINGSGKSTIINYLYSMINTPDFHISNDSLIKDMGLTFSDKTIINNQDYIYLDYFKQVEGYKEIIDKEKESIEKDKKIIEKYKEIIEKDIIYKIQINNSINIDYITTFDTKLKPQELLKKVDDNTKTELDFQLWNLQKKYLNYQINIGKRLRANKGNIDDNSTYFHDKFIEIIDSLFSETDKKINQDENELAFLLGSKEINAYQLSSGEKQLLIILLTVLIQDNKPSILFMDEPEISLHIDWQENLINYIRELNPNVQLIIATHSPGIIMKGWGDKVFELSGLTVKDRLAS